MELIALVMQPGTVIALSYALHYYIFPACITRTINSKYSNYSNWIYKLYGDFGQRKILDVTFFKISRRFHRELTRFYRFLRILLMVCMVTFSSYKKHNIYQALEGITFCN